MCKRWLKKAVLLLQQKKIFQVMVAVLIVVLTIIIINSMRHRDKEKLLSVRVAQALIQPMPILIEAPGVVEAEETVSITPQVTGTIQKIRFNQGEEVKKGQLLFEIDPAPFVATLNQVNATLLRDQATLSQNRADANRYAELVKKEFVTRQQYEQAETVARAQEELVEADKAQVHQAEIALGYTRIRAPIEGKTGSVMVRQGDLVVANSATPLVTINKINPILVDFNLTQSQLKSLLAYQKEGPLKVMVMTDSADQVIEDGELVFIDNNVNTQTGTVLLKAGVSNADHNLWPGMITSVQLILTVEPDAVVVPVSVIQVDQKGSFVYRLVDNKAKVQRVEVSRQVGEWSVISKGLKGMEKIISTISPELSDGKKVIVLEDKGKGN